MVVKVKNLVKRYKELIALEHFNMEVEEGEILGLLGPNGCGKTTAINCILSLLSFDKGEIEIFGKKMTPNSYDIKKQIGIVPQEVSVFENLTVRENIDYFCGLYIEDKNLRKQYVEDIIEKALTIITLLVGIRYTWHKGTELKLKNIQSS